MSAEPDARGLSARFDADELLRHATWLRGLARALVRPDDVEDVVQETWAAALAHPPGSAAALRNWLDRVVRNVARQLSRSTLRRERREQAAAPHESQPSTADVAARAALHRELVGRVLALDEPTRSVVLLRFFDGLRAAEIAKRVGASEEAVRQRLKRGLDRIRAQLDAEHEGKREEWLGGFAALASGAGVGAWTISKVQVALAAGVIAMAGAGWIWWTATPGDRHGPEIAADTEEAHAVDPTAPASAETSASGVAAKASIAPAESHEAERAAVVPDALPVHMVYGAVLAGDGTPMEEAGVSVGALSADETRTPTRRQPWEVQAKSGSYAIAGLDPGRYRLHADHVGFVTIERELTIAPDVAAQRFDLVFKRRISIPVRLLAPDGRRLVDAVAADDPDFPLQHLAVLAMPVPPPDRLPPTGSCQETDASSARWLVPKGRLTRYGQSEVPTPDGCDGVLMFERIEPFHAVAALKNVVVGTTFIAKPDDAGGGIALTVDPAAIRSALATVRVHCVTGPDAHPVAGVELRISDSQGWASNSARTNADGVATIPRVPPGILTCEVGPWDFDARVEAAGVTDLGTFDLSPAQAVTGRVVDEHGKELDGQTSWIDVGQWTPGMPLDDRGIYSSDPAGGIRIVTLARSRYLVHAGGPEIAENRLLVDLTSGSSAPIEVRVARGTSVHFENHGKAPLLPTIFEVATKEGLPVYARFGIGDLRLVPGDYRLTLWRDRESMARLDFTVGAEPMVVALPELSGPHRDIANRGGDADAAGTLLSRLPRDPAGIVVYGRVTAPTAADLQDGWIGAIGTDHRRSDTQLRRGCYAFAGISPGETELAASGASRLGRIEWIDVPAAPLVFRHDFAPAAARRTIAIALVDGATGKSLQLPATDPERNGSSSRFDVVATEDELQIGESDADVEASGNARIGRFGWSASSRFENVPSEGVLELDRDGEAFVSLLCGGRVLNTERIEASVGRVELRVDRDAVLAALATLRVRLVDSTSGVALAPTAFFVTFPGFVFGQKRDASTPVDDVGTREIAGLAPVDSKVIIEVADHERIEHLVRLVAGMNDLGTLELGTTKKIRGRVVDLDGKPLVCVVAVEDVGRGSARLALTASRRHLTATDGSFEFDVGRSTYEIRIDNPDRASKVETLVTTGTIPDEIRLVSTTGTLVTIHVEGLGSSAASAIVVDQRDRIVVRRRLGDLALRLRLEPGRYVVRALARDGVTTVGSASFEMKDAPVEVGLQK